MLTDEQARRFAKCDACRGSGKVFAGWGDRAGQVDCTRCGATGIDPAKRTELEELLREAMRMAWESGHFDGLDDGRSEGYPPLPHAPNPYAKEPTDG